MLLLVVVVLGVAPSRIIRLLAALVLVVIGQALAVSLLVVGLLLKRLRMCMETSLFRLGLVGLEQLEPALTALKVFFTLSLLRVAVGVVAIAEME
jgi:hypothetical protein